MKIMGANQRQMISMESVGLRTARQALNLLLKDGNTLADYQGGVGFTGVTNCSSWANQIGAAGPLVGAGTGGGPSISGQTLVFNGTNQNLSVALTQTQPFFIYTVIKQVVWAGNNSLFDSTSRALIGNHNGTPEIDLYAGSAVVCANTGLAVGSFGCVSAGFNGASSSLKVDGGAAVIGNPGAAGTGGTLFVASDNTPVQFASMQVKEIIVRNGADSAATQAAIQALLKSIWGTP